ncbi:hypothetical protein B5X24_HaOG203143 [Helicoverpa armigera]|uniref:G-protein coupled receptors family 1 profile domain-containing protein n=1 Tax=Helicoverpa armigera TaxID=29058 RepID=A0A2W1BVG2_HELAM|nr:hypothetical protein B5X24_HaOG203143 [Helicoverpa armigera]
MNFVKKISIFIIGLIILTSVEGIHAEETRTDLKNNETKLRHNKTIEDLTAENATASDEPSKENATEVCVGQKEFCNLSKEEYVSMLNNYIYPHTYEWVLIGTHTLVFITGLVGNALVCVAVYRNHSMRTVTNYFIVNLAAADFMVILFCLPATVVWDVTETWFLGDVLCKMLLYFQVRLIF